MIPKFDAKPNPDKAVARIIFLPRRRKLRPEKIKSEARSGGGGGVLGEGQPAPAHQLGSLGSAVSSPGPGRQTVFTRFKCSEWPLQAV